MGEQEATQWTVVRGAVPSLASLEVTLRVVKALYREKTGYDVDAESDDEIEADGIQWIVTRGVAPSMSRLEFMLQQIKAAYKAKTGRDVDAESDDDVANK